MLFWIALFGRALATEILFCREKLKHANAPIIAANVANNHQESPYQPREPIWITHYAKNLIVDSL